MDRSRVWGPAGVNTWADIIFIIFVSDMPNAASSAKIAIGLLMIRNAISRHRARV